MSSRTAWIVLVALTMAGACLRLDYLSNSGWVIDADEAIVGLMGKHISEGREVPIFYYGQHYMGSLEAILAALSFKLFGMSALTLKLVPLLFSLALIPLIFLLGRAIGGTGSGLLAATFMALPPVALVEWSSKARGGFIEILFLGALALLLTVRLLKQERARDLCLLGFVLGLGWWVNNQIVYFGLPIAAILAVHILRSFGVARFVRAAALGALAFIVGSAPFWVYNLRHDFASFGMFGLAGSEQVLDHAAGLFSMALPIIMGAKRFWTESEIFPGAMWLGYGLYGALFLVGSIFTARFALGKSGAAVAAPSREAARNQLEGAPTAAPLSLLQAFVLTTLLIFTLSSFGWLVQAPRYLLPLYVGLFPLFGYALVQVRSRLAVASATLLMLGLHLSSYLYNGPAIAGEPIVYDGQRVSKDHSALIAWLHRSNTNLVRTNYWIGYRLAFETAEQVRFGIFQVPRSVRLPQYEEDVRNTTPDDVPYVLVPAQAALVERAIKALGMLYQRAELSGYVVLSDIRPSVTGLTPISGLIADTPLDSPRASLAIDGDDATRWGSAQPQTPGMEFTVTLPPASLGTKIRGLEYHLGEFKHDYPRSLKISAELVDGSRKEIYSAENHPAVMYFLDQGNTIRIYFDGIPIKRLIFSQGGQHPVFDWSIAEIVVLQ